MYSGTVLAHLLGLLLGPPLVFAGPTPLLALCLPPPTPPHPAPTCGRAEVKVKGGNGRQINVGVIREDPGGEKQLYFGLLLNRLDPTPLGKCPNLS